mmetsp:Transcript_37388/g.57381  ORF Transcript_37388/g.57381 Transcript_37388/m.57381 type:complete len:80 (+) Transcript_37388:30-269(+)
MKEQPTASSYSDRFSIHYDPNSFMEPSVYPFFVISQKCMQDQSGLKKSPETQVRQSETCLPICCIKTPCEKPSRRKTQE